VALVKETVAWEVFNIIARRSSSFAACPTIELAALSIALLNSSCFLVASSSSLSILSTDLAASSPFDPMPSNMLNMAPNIPAMPMPGNINAINLLK
jgi:hypothetical protein